MEIPKNIHGINKIRDAKILSLAVDGYSSDEIAQWLVEHKIYKGVGKPESIASLVRKICYKNRASLKIDKDYENFKQTVRIRRKAEKLDKTDVLHTAAIAYENLLDSKIGKKSEGSQNTGEVKIIIVRPKEEQPKAESNGTHHRLEGLQRTLSV